MSTVALQNRPGGRGWLPAQFSQTSAINPSGSSFQVMLLLYYGTPNGSRPPSLTPGTRLSAAGPPKAPRFEERISGPTGNSGNAGFGDVGCSWRCVECLASRPAQICTGDDRSRRLCGSLGAIAFTRRITGRGRLQRRRLRTAGCRRKLIAALSLSPPHERLQLLEKDVVSLPHGTGAQPPPHVGPGDTFRGTRPGRDLTRPEPPAWQSPYYIPFREGVPR